MPESSLIFEKLCKHWPDHCETVGEDNVKKVLEERMGLAGPANVVVPKDGDAFDITPIMGVIIAAFSFLLKLYEFLKEHQEPEPGPSAREIAKRVVKESPELGKLDFELLVFITEEVIGEARTCQHNR